MKFHEVKKGDYIINAKMPEAKPWWVIGKYTWMVVIRRKPKIGKLIALTVRQLRDFEKYDKSRKY